MNSGGTIAALLILSGICLLGYIVHLEGERQRSRPDRPERDSLPLSPDEAVDQVKSYLAETTPFA